MQNFKTNSKKLLDTKSIILCSLFSALVCVGAFIKIPIPPVPFTMQWFFVAMSGLLLGSKLGFISVIVYILIGLAGVPVFTQGGGLHYIYIPTFGYIIGFAIASFVIGRITENRKKSFKTYFLANMIGLFFVYLIGFSYLYFITTVVAGKNVVFFNLLKAAVLIFVPTDTISALISAKVASKIPNLK